MIRISFIVPVFNQQAYLVKCIESLCKQTLVEIEILLIDNGSTDQSSQICQDYAGSDSRIRYIRLEQCGVGIARNTGLELARGEYVGFVDSDDYLDDDFARKMYALAHRNQSIFCYCGITKFYDQSPRKYYFYPLNFTDGEAFFKNHEISNPVWNKIFRRDIIEKYALRFSNCLNYVEDYAFVCLFYWLGKGGENNITACPELLYCYRQHQNSTMAKIYTNLLSRIVELEQNVAEILAKLQCSFINKKIPRLIKSAVLDYYLIELPLWLIKSALNEHQLTTCQAKEILNNYQQLVSKYRTGFTFQGKIIRLLALIEIHFQLRFNHAKY